jgi:hypothetical protein
MAHEGTCSKALFVLYLLSPCSLTVSSSLCNFLPSNYGTFKVVSRDLLCLASFHSFAPARGASHEV